MHAVNARNAATSQEGTDWVDSVLAVGERVGIDDEIQQMRGLRLHTGIGGRAEPALVEIAE